YGSTPLSVTDTGSLLAETPSDYKVWMSHGDSVAEAPAGFDVLASTPDTPVAAFECPAKRFAGVQWHPEVLHSEHGQKILENFLYNVAGLDADWTNASVIDEQVELIRARVGQKKVICALSGGVDSSVAAALVHKAIGDQLTRVSLDHGLLRENDRAPVRQAYDASIGRRLATAHAREQFLTQLSGVTDPEENRTLIGREFIRNFESAAADLVPEAQDEGEEIASLVQGTL